MAKHSSTSLLRHELAATRRVIAMVKADEAKERQQRDRAAEIRSAKAAGKAIALKSPADHMKVQQQETRKRVEAALKAAGSAWISDIAAATDLRHETASQHLAALEKAGKAHRQGKAFPYHWVDQDQSAAQAA